MEKKGIKNITFYRVGMSLISLGALVGCSNSVAKNDIQSYMEHEAEEFTIDDTKYYTLSGYIGKDHAELLFLGSEEEDLRCDAIHKYYYRYNSDTGKVEPAGFTCAGNEYKHIQDNKNLLLEPTGFIDYSTHITGRVMKNGGIDNQVTQSLLREVADDECIYDRDYEFNDKKGRTLCMVVMNTDENTDEDTRQFYATYLYDAYGEKELPAFFDVLSMEWIDCEGREVTYFPMEDMASSFIYDIVSDSDEFEESALEIDLGEKISTGQIGVIIDDMRMLSDEEEVANVSSAQYHL